MQGKRCQLFAEMKEFKNKDKRSKAYWKSVGRNVSSNECHHHPRLPLSSDDEQGRKRALWGSQSHTVCFRKWNLQYREFFHQSLSSQHKQIHHS